MGRRRAGPWVALVALSLALPAAAQQQGPINPRIPPVPPEESVSQPVAKPTPPATPNPATPPPAPPAVVPGPAPTAPPPTIPTSVTIPSGTRVAVVLDMPLSTRISKPGQTVAFHTTDPLRVHAALEIPPDTTFSGSVVEVKRPGGFGRKGALRVKVERIQLTNGPSAPTVARLDSPDTNAQGRISSDNNRVADLYTVGAMAAEGALLGVQIKGGKGAAVGAGAGAAIGLIILMSHRGPDIYLEPGMPFTIVIDQPVELAGAAVFTAQQAYANSRARDANADEDASASGGVGRNPEGAELDRDRPKLKRRAKKPQP